MTDTLIFAALHQLGYLLVMIGLKTAREELVFLLLGNLYLFLFFFESKYRS